MARKSKAGKKRGSKDSAKKEETHRLCIEDPKNLKEEMKKKKLENMKQDYEYHLEQKRNEMQLNLKDSQNRIRQKYQTLLMQIPRTIQDMTIEELMAKGGSITSEDGPIGVQIRLPRAAVNTDAFQVPQVPPKSFKKPEPPKTVGHKSSNRKVVETVPRIMTRSVAKLSAMKEEVHTQLEASPDIVTCTLQRATKANNNDDEKIKKSLSQLSIKTAREPKPYETVIGPITIYCSTAGTPLIIDQKTIERISKGDLD